MQEDLRHSHFSDRFKQYYGRSFTQIDKRKILGILAEGDFKKYRSYYSKDVRLCLVYEDKKIVIVLDKADGTFITCYPVRKQHQGLFVE